MRLVFTGRANTFTFVTGFIRQFDYDVELS